MDLENNILVIEGPPLAGKSTLARALGKISGAVVFSQDDVLSDILPDSDHQLVDRILSYDEMHTRAIAEQLQHPVLLEGTYSRREYRDSFSQRIHTTQIYVVEIHITPEEALARFAQRKGHPGINNTDKIIFDRALHYPYSDDAVSIDGALSQEEQIETVASMVDEHRMLNVENWVNLL